jgi:putative transposase
MPNHVHGIIIITDNASVVPTVGTRLASSVPTIRPKGATSGSLGAIVGSYKSGVTRHIRKFLQHPDLIVWQGRYHDHIIRDEADLNRIREYVLYNPSRWQEDVFYHG